MDNSLPFPKLINFSTCWHVFTWAGSECKRWMCKSTAGGKLDVSGPAAVLRVSYSVWLSQSSICCGPGLRGFCHPRLGEPQCRLFLSRQLPILGWQTASWHPRLCEHELTETRAGYFQPCILIFLLVETAPSTPPWIWILCYLGYFTIPPLDYCTNEETQMWIRFSLCFNLGDRMQWFNNDLLFLPFRLCLKEQCVFHTLRKSLQNLIIQEAHIFSIS